MCVIIEMEYREKRFSELSVPELYEILRARSAVFVVEQQCVYQDVDGTDRRAWHLWYEAEGRVWAYARVYWKEEAGRVAQIGRVLTVARGQGLGLRLLRRAVELCEGRLGATTVCLEAQTYAVGFYEKMDFRVVSEEFLEDGIPHVRMVRRVARR